METEQIDKLFLELAQVTRATTPAMRRLQDEVKSAARRVGELEEYLRANCLACLSCCGTGHGQRAPEFKCFDCNGTGLAGHAKTSVDDPGAGRGR